MKKITIIIIFLFIMILCPKNVYADACGFKYQYNANIKENEFEITISKCNQEFEYYVEYDKTMLEFKESTSYSNSICAGNNFNDIVNVTDENGKLTISRKTQGNCNVYDGNESYVTLKFKTLKTGETSLKISPTIFYMQPVNGDNETVENDSKTGLDVLKIKINILEIGTSEKECQKCEICQECPMQEKCENNKEEQALPISLIISLAVNIVLIITVIIIHNKN